MGVDTEERFASLLPDIEKTAKRLAYQYPSLEYEDIRQDLAEYAWKHRDQIRTYGAEGGNPLMILSREGKRLCGKAIASRSIRDDRYWYAPKEVRALLDEGALFSRDGDIDGRSDLLLAVKALSEDERAVIAGAYLKREHRYRLPGADSKALTRVVDRVALEMNRIGEGRSSWHNDRISWVGSRSLVDRAAPTY